MGPRKIQGLPELGNTNLCSLTLRYLLYGRFCQGIGIIAVSRLVAGSRLGEKGFLRPDLPL